MSGAANAKMSASQFLEDTKRRGTQWLYQKTGMHQADKDRDFEEINARFTVMADDMNELGAGISTSLRDIKTCFATHQKLARVLDKFYNGELNRPWPEVNQMGQMKSHPVAERFKNNWEHAHGKVRPSAAAVCIERSLDRLRFFANSSVPDLKAKVAERNAAELDFQSYQRRLDALQGKSSSADAVSRIRGQLAVTKERYDNLNASVKDDLVKEKMSRDVMVEESLMTLIVCQAEIYGDIAAGLNDLVQSFPPEKVLSIQSKIKDLVRVGGPTIAQKETSTMSKAAQVGLGVKTVADFTQTEEQKAAEAARAQERLQAARKVAVEEEQMRNQMGGMGGGSSTPPPVPPTPPGGTVRARALYACEAENEGDLAFHAGDIITVVSRDDSGWWTGSIGGATGLFPANYVQIMN